MALKPWQDCPGNCGNYTRGGRCPECDKQQRQQYQKQTASRRGTTTEQGYGHGWRKVRRAYLSRNPLCEDCLSNGKTKAAGVVHHVTPLDQGGTNRFDNLQALCRECHEAKHKRF